MIKIKMTEEGLSPPSIEDLSEAFAIFESKGGSLIPDSEMTSIISEIVDKQTEKEIGSMIGQADTNEDGVISYQEFVDMMNVKMEQQGLQPPTTAELAKAF